MALDISQIQEDAAQLRSNAQSMARAAQYMKAAAGELAPVVVPAARKAAVGSVHTAGKVLGSMPAFPDKLAAKLASLDEAQLKRGIIVSAAASAAVGVGLTAAGIAHIVHHRRKRKQEREEREAREAESA